MIRSIELKDNVCMMSTYCRWYCILLWIKTSHKLLTCYQFFIIIMIWMFTSTKMNTQKRGGVNALWTAQFFFMLSFTFQSYLFFYHTNKMMLLSISVLYFKTIFWMIWEVNKKKSKEESQGFQIQDDLLHIIAILCFKRLY